MERNNYLYVAVNVLIWYYTSAISASSSQSLVQYLGITHWKEKLFTMIFVTFLQMITGICMGLILAFLIRCCYNLFFHRTEHQHLQINLFQIQTKEESYTFKLSLISLEHLIFPCFHVTGTLFTNLGYSFSSASFVQVIKLTEPIQTISIDIILRKFWNIPQQKINFSIITCSIIGTCLVLFGRYKLSSFLQQSNNIFSWATVMVFCSGFFLSMRNVMKKIIHLKNNDQINNDAITISKVQPVISISSKIIEGLTDFIHLSLGGFIIFLPVISIFLLVWSNSRLISSNILSSKLTYIVAISHAAYNMASLIVLSFVSAPIHSLLNSGKRLTSTLVVMLWFRETLTPEIGLGFMFIVIGVIPSISTYYRFIMITAVVCIFLFLRNSLQGLNIKIE